MNKQLIEKVITSNNERCPELTYSNPLLDRSTAAALSKSFIKILRVSNQNSNINNNLRLSILENIRKMCQVEPENHLKVDENITELLKEVYQDNIKNTSLREDSTEKQLDAFLMRRTMEMGTSSSFETSQNPEVLQALVNLNERGVYIQALSNEFIHWNVSNPKFLSVLKDLWNNNIIEDSDTRSQNNATFDVTFDDISIKLKTEIEKFLLETCHSVLLSTDNETENQFSNPTLINIVKNSSISPNSFRMCCGILNFIFIMTNFDLRIQTLITSFVKHIKDACPQKIISVLYPIHLSSVALLLDFAINNMPPQIKKLYSQNAVNNLNNIRKRSETDLIMMLSHFPQWFDIYFSQEN